MKKIIIILLSLAILSGCLPPRHFPRHPPPPHRHYSSVINISMME